MILEAIKLDVPTGSIGIHNVNEDGHVVFLNTRETLYKAHNQADYVSKWSFIDMSTSRCHANGSFTSLRDLLLSNCESPNCLLVCENDSDIKKVVAEYL